MSIPTHVGIIVDGNGRWAQNRGLKRSQGHKVGAERINALCEYVFDRGIHILSLYIFSTENFKRSEEEVNFLMDLLIQKVKKDFLTLHKKGVKIVFSGRKYPLSKNVLDAISDLQKKTKDNTNGILNICLNYGSHFEIMDACKHIAYDHQNQKIDLEKLDEDMFRKYLYQDLPDLDLVIRTGGELRLSNFMLWQAAYSEFYFTDTYFPDFDNREFDKALESYQNRDRRFGGIHYEKKSD